MDEQDTQTQRVSVNAAALDSLEREYGCCDFSDALDRRPIEGTVEYAVQCADGTIQVHGYTNGVGQWRWEGPTAEVPDLWMDHVGKFPCGPHRVVQRTVSAWEPLP